MFLITILTASVLLFVSVGRNRSFYLDVATVDDAK